MWGGRVAALSVHPTLLLLSSPSSADPSLFTPQEHSRSIHPIVVARPTPRKLAWKGRKEERKKGRKEETQLTSPPPPPPPRRYLTTVEHHDLHHQLYTIHFGLYFQVWDRLMGTNRKEKEKEDSSLKGVKKKKRRG